MRENVTMAVGPGQEDNPIFGQYLNDLRISKKISRAEASRRLGVSLEYIRLIERGERTPALSTAAKLFDIYGVPYIFSRSQIVLANTSITFTSRIKESRSSIIAPPNRNELIGQIVRLLVLADDDTLKQLHSKLVKS